MPCGALLELGWLAVNKTVKRADEVSESDHLELDVRLLPVLEARRLGELLREELSQRGWTKNADGSMSKPFGDGVATLEKEGSTIRLVVKAKQSIEVEATATGRAKEEDQAAQQAVEDQAAADADAKLAARRRLAKEDLIRENLEKLEKVQGALQQEVDEVSAATTKRALVERAQQLGAIESINERRTQEGVEVVIQVVKS
jgi:hypothetical protein